MLRREFARFLIVGALAALLNWASRIALSYWLSLEVSIVVAHIIGMAFAYLAARRLAFRLRGKYSASEFGRYALVNVISLAQTWIVTIGISRFALEALGFSSTWDAVSHAMGIGSTAFTAYFLHRHFTFADARRTSQADGA